MVEILCCKDGDERIEVDMIWLRVIIVECAIALPEDLLTPCPTALPWLRQELHKILLRHSSDCILICRLQFQTKPKEAEDMNLPLMEG